MQDELVIPSGLPEDFSPSPHEGLSPDEASRRREQGLGNASTADEGKTLWQILRENLFTLFNLLNVCLALALLLVGSYRNMLFMGVVISNTLIGTVQELRARNTIRKLQVLSAPTVHVMRGGTEEACKPDDLVKGDVVILRAGDQVCADAIVLEGSGAANESLLTGESEAVIKHRHDWLMSGSYITEGRFVAQLERVGDDSYANRLTRSARKIKRPQSALMTDLNKLIKLVSCILMPLGILLFCKQYFLAGAPLTQAVPSSVAAMIGMIPEGLILLTSVAMAVGVIKLGRRDTLVQELYGIETLARADVLCLDKTGTITTGEMTVTALHPLDGDEAALTAALSRFLGAFETTSGTLRALAEKATPGSEQPVAVLPFSSQRKKSAASFADGTTLILGAPAMVLGDAYTGEVQRLAEKAAAAGSRVLALAEAEGRVTETGVPAEPRALGLIVLADTLRPNAAQTLRYFQQQGVTVKIISGDDPRTVSAIASRVELPGWDMWVDASTLQTQEDIEAACERYTVFGRVTPSQKQQLVEALKRSGHSVAMTGDGVNDIPALKAADCSIAMAGGSDAAKHAAQLTLLTADFACLPLVVGEGRRVVNNITRSASLFLVKTLYSFALSVLLLLLPGAYPFQPIQLTLISTLTIGTPSFFLALEPNEERIRGSFLETVLSRAIPGAAAVALCATLSMMTAHLGWSSEVSSTLATLSAGCIGLMVLFTVCWPFSSLRAALWGLMAAGFALGVLALGKIFFLVPLSGTQLLVLAALVLLGGAILFAARSLMNRRTHQHQQAQA
ncbi:MAG: HAD-IC family P-type ATPase [Clostridia bacterium]|nr:HAD-IC family P-type ATPase [Clostridia bacterium]